MSCKELLLFELVDICSTFRVSVPESGSPFIPESWLRSRTTDRTSRNKHCRNRKHQGFVYIHDTGDEETGTMTWAIMGSDQPRASALRKGLGREYANIKARVLISGFDIEGLRSLD